MSNLDREYWERRRQECLARAESVSDPALAQLHREFAAGYERKLAGDQSRTLHIASPR